MHLRLSLAALCCALLGPASKAQTIFVPGGVSTGIGTSSTNVGIGTNTPRATLSLGNGNGKRLLVYDNDANIQAGFGINLSPDGREFTIFGPDDGTTGTGGGHISFGLMTNASTYTEHMRLAQNGNIGIGTNNPATKLEVVGVATVDYLLIDPQGGPTEGGELALRGTGGNNDVNIDNLNGNIRVFFPGAGGTRTLQLWSGQIYADGWENNYFAGNVGIGTTTPSHKLSVNGTIRAKAIIVDTGWADYVFEEKYRLAPLVEVESHIKEKGHLPGIPSAAEVAEHGVDMGEMQSKLLAKIEELTLHLIAQEKKLATQSQRLERLEAENTQLREEETLSALPRSVHRTSRARSATQGQ